MCHYRMLKRESWGCAVESTLVFFAQATYPGFGESDDWVVFSSQRRQAIQEQASLEGVLGVDEYSVNYCDYAEGDIIA
jgi:hypothetical protein